MRQLTVAWYLYTLDNDDKLCSANTEWNDPGCNWVADGERVVGNVTGGTEVAIEEGALWSYAGKTVDLYKCKELV